MKSNLAEDGLDFLACGWDNDSGSLSVFAHLVGRILGTWERR